MAIAVCGGKCTEGELVIQGSKNAILPIMSAALLGSEPSVIENCPEITDVYAMADVIRETGAKVTKEGKTLVIDPAGMYSGHVRDRKVQEIRASVLLLGSLLSSFRTVHMDYPGGCSIGKRPIDFHLQAFMRMGALIREEDAGVDCEVPGKLRGTTIQLPFPSVGATENILLAAVRAEGTTWIQNAAREPEIVELCRFLKKMGAVIQGEGSSHILVSGVKKMHGIRWKMSADRMAFLTYALMTAGCGGDCFFFLGETEPSRETSVLAKLGCELSIYENGVRVVQKRRPKGGMNVRTAPYPGFPTDAQPLLMAALTKSSGISMIEESVFENRFRIVRHLQKMGANIDCVSTHASITGVTKLHAGEVEAEDLRSGAGLLIAASMADGESRINGSHYIRRGYEDPVEQMKKISLTASWCE